MLGRCKFSLCRVELGCRVEPGTTSKRSLLVGGTSSSIGLTGNSRYTNSVYTVHKHQNAKLAILPKIITTFQLLIMAPPTRLNPLRTPSPEPLAGREATTTRKCKFYDALARDGEFKSLRWILADCKILEAYGRK